MDVVRAATSDQRRCWIVRWEHMCLVHAIGSLGFLKQVEMVESVACKQCAIQGLKKRDRGHWWQGHWHCEVFKDLLWLGVCNGVRVQDIFSLHSMTRNKLCVGSGWWHRPEILYVKKGNRGKPGLYIIYYTLTLTLMTKKKKSRNPASEMICTVASHPWVATVPSCCASDCDFSETPFGACFSLGIYIGHNNPLFEAQSLYSFWWDKTKAADNTAHNRQLCFYGLTQNSSKLNMPCYCLGLKPQPPSHTHP